MSMRPSAQCTPLRNGVQVGGWRFESESGRILSTREINTLTERLEALTVAEALPSAVPPLPAAIFGHSYLTLTHEASGRVIHFDADGAITSWVRESAEKGSGGLKVTTENAWFAARPSGTEDVYKIYAESFRGPEHLAEVQDAAREVVNKVIS